MAGIVFVPAYFHDLKLPVDRLSGLTKLPSGVERVFEDFALHGC